MLALAAACITLLVLEVALRFLGFHAPVLYCPREDTGYDLRPNQHLRVLRNEIRINDASLRDARDLAGREKTPGTLRIGVFGDSVTWAGVRMRQKDLFTTRLERLLAETYGDSAFEVYNGGVNAYSVKQTVTKAERTHPIAKFDLIIIYLIEADFYRNPHVVLQKDALPLPQSNHASAVWQAAGRSIVIINLKSGGRLFPPSDAAAFTRELSDEEALKANFDALLAFQADMRKENVPVVIFLSPHKSLLEDDGTRFATLARGLEGRIHLVKNLLDDFRERVPEAAGFYYDHVHLSVEGHEFVSRRIAAYLRETGIVEQMVRDREIRGE